MTKKKLLTIIDKYLNGTAESDEIKMLDEYYNSFQNEKLIQSSDEIFVDKNELKIRLWNKIESDNNEPINQKYLFLLKFKNNTVYLAAALIGFVLIILSFSWMIMHPSNANKKFITITTHIGERKMVQLTDGSKIWLGPMSFLKFPENFDGEKDRNVSFLGNGLFEVMHNQSQPFVISSNKMVTKVLGTVFNVMTTKNKNEVTLISGHVSVKTYGKEIILNPNQKAVVDIYKRTIKQENAIDASDLLSKKDGHYSFKGVNIFEVVRQLNMIYNCPIEVNGNIKNCKFYGSFDDSDSEEKILKIISISINGNYYKTKSNKYIISGTGCN